MVKSNFMLRYVTLRYVISSYLNLVIKASILVPTLVGSFELRYQFSELHASIFCEGPGNGLQEPVHIPDSWKGNCSLRRGGARSLLVRLAHKSKKKNKKWRTLRKSPCLKPSEGPAPGREEKEKGFFYLAAYSSPPSSLFFKLEDSTVLRKSIAGF